MTEEAGAEPEILTRGNGLSNAGSADATSSLHCIDLGAGAFAADGFLLGVNFAVARAGQEGHRFQIYRPIAGNEYLLVAESQPIASPEACARQRERFRTPLAFRAGDFCGWSHEGKGVVAYVSGANDVRWKLGLQKVGSSVNFTSGSRCVYSYEMVYSEGVAPPPPRIPGPAIKAQEEPLPARCAGCRGSGRHKGLICVSCLGRGKAVVDSPDSPTSRKRREELDRLESAVRAEREELRRHREKQLAEEESLSRKREALRLDLLRGGEEVERLKKEAEGVLLSARIHVGEVQEPKVSDIVEVKALGKRGTVTAVDGRSDLPYEVAFADDCGGGLDRYCAQSLRIVKVGAGAEAGAIAEERRSLRADEEQLMRMAAEIGEREVALELEREEIVRSRRSLVMVQGCLHIARLDASASKSPGPVNHRLEQDEGGAYDEEVWDMDWAAVSPVMESAAEDTDAGTK